MSVTLASDGTILKGNQEPLVVKDKDEDPYVSLE